MRNPLRLLFGLTLGLGIVLTGCSGTGETGSASSTTTVSTPPASSSSASPEQSDTPPSNAKPVTPEVVGQVANGLQAPWSVVPLSDGGALISERDTGRILLLDTTTGNTGEVGRVANLEATGEAGLMGLASNAAESQVFAMYTAADGNRVVRMSWDGSRLGNEKLLLGGIPRATFHDGGRLAVGPDGLLYAATGDAGQPDNAQNIGSLSGKILRLKPHGGVPKGNPFRPSLVYSLGHRNVQGLAFDDDGRLWASEFGAKDFDELNLIEPGGNYGWPIFEGPSDDPEYVSPQAWWSPTSIASPSGIAVAAGSVWVATLVGETLWQVPISDGGAGDPVARFKQKYGRLRDVVSLPSGKLWLLTNNTDGRGTPRSGDDQVLRVKLE
jgi:glucose/arabinose dehydrogenase